MFPIPSVEDLNHLFEQENFDFRYELIYTLILLILLVLGRILVRIKVAKRLKSRGLGHITTLQSIKIIRMALFVVFLAVLIPVWAEKLEKLGLYVVSFLAVLGFAFTATFSLLSNIPASLVLFLAHPMRIGSRVRLLDGKDTISGRVLDISLFSVRIMTDEGVMAVFPNVLALQRGILVLRDEPEAVK